MTFTLASQTDSSVAKRATKAVVRLDAIDSAKGIGIILVVFGHAWRGAMGAGVIAENALFHTIDFAIYAFHMPLFFFLSGLLFLETMQKYGMFVLLRGRVKRLLWPMALWTWLFFGLRLAAGQSVNNPVTLSEFPIIPLPPYEHLWFLWALFLCQTALIVLHSVPTMRCSAIIWRWGAAISALVLAVLNPVVAVPSAMFGPLFEHAPYFLAGVAAGGLVAIRPATWIGIVCGFGFVVLLMAVGTQKAAVVYSLMIVLSAWTAWQCVDQNGDIRVLQMLRTLGKASMVIYLTHTIFTAGLRILLLEVGVVAPFIILVSTVFVGLSAPLLVAWTARSVGITKYLGF